MILYYNTNVWTTDVANDNDVDTTAGGDAGCRRLRRNCGDVRGAATATVVGPIQSGSPGLRGRLRLRWCPSARCRPRGTGRQQDGALRRRADGGRLRAVRRVQARLVGVRGRFVPASGTATPVQPCRPAGAHGGAEGDGRRAIRYRAQDVHRRARGRVQASRSRRGGTRPVDLLQLSGGRQKINIVEKATGKKGTNDEKKAVILFTRVL